VVGEEDLRLLIEHQEEEVAILHLAYSDLEEVEEEEDLDLLSLEEVVEGEVLISTIAATSTKP